MNTDEKWMNLALEEATKAQEANEIPVGAIIINNNKIIETSHNQSIMRNDPTAHAEILLLKKAGERQKNYRLIGTTLYVTLEPCAMCLGAMMHARIKRVVFGAYDKKTGVCGSCINLTNADCFNHTIRFTGGVLEKECKNILQIFFKDKR